jgi:AraC-like DNA-binding protein
VSAVSVRVFQLVLAGAAARGVDPGALLRAAGLSGEELADPDGRLSRAAELRMWTQAALATEDDCFGIHLCEQLFVGSLGPLGFAVRSSATLGDAYQRVIRYLRLLVQGPVLELRVEDDVARLRHRAPPTGPAPSRHAVEFLLGNMVVLARRGVGATLVPRAVGFRHAAPSRIDRYHALFGRNVRFDQPHYEIVLERELLARPQQQAEPALASVLDRHLSSLLASAPAGGTFLERVDAALAAELERGEPSVGAIASRLQMSPRTLQRHLGREGTSLSERLDRTRETLATRLLGEPGRSIAEVAFLLGFSEVSTFHRAFKRWKGVTPGAYRRGGEA